MPIDVTCPKCGAGLPVPEEFAGRTVRCGGCAEMISVPGGDTAPPPLPISDEAPPPLPAPVAKPAVAKPVARAVPVSAEPNASPVPPKPVKPFEPVSRPSVFPKPVSNEENNREPIRPQTMTAFFVVAGLILFGCCGVSVLGYAFVQVTKQVAKNNRENALTPNTNPVSPKATPDSPKSPATPRIVTPKRTEPKQNNPPIPAPFTPTLPRPKGPNIPQPTLPGGPAPRANVPNPQGMNGLKLYVSFDNETVREDISRAKLAYDGFVRLVDGPRNKAARPFAIPHRGEEGLKFTIDLGTSANAFRFAKDAPFTIALWVRGGGPDGAAFALTQQSEELAPRLLFKSNTRSVGVELYCDESDSDKKFVRTKTVPFQAISTPFYHLTLTRTADGTLAFYINGEAIKDGPAESLPAKQPVALRFQHAGFALRHTTMPYTIELDEFCLFDRALTADEVLKLAGKKGK
jgi:hypothetical protein